MQETPPDYEKAVQRFRQAKRAYERAKVNLLIVASQHEDIMSGKRDTVKDVLEASLPGQLHEVAANIRRSNRTTYGLLEYYMMKGMVTKTGFRRKYTYVWNPRTSLPSAVVVNHEIEHGSSKNMEIDKEGFDFNEYS